jgi:MarR family transcriptional regulator, temperature-dependent positive regulator of motility
VVILMQQGTINREMKTAPVQGSMNLLTRLSRVLYRRATEDVIGLRMKPFIALDYLREQGPSSQQQFGRDLMLDPNNAVILLNDLEQAGYVERRRDPTDRRRHIVEITSAGARAAEHAEHKLETVEDEVLGKLSAAERSKLRDLLAKALEGDRGEAD